MNDSKKFNIDNFYSAESVKEWQEIIGKDLHYHFGYFQSDEDLETGLKQTVRNFYDFIPSNSNILDVGCGWGAPAKMLITEKNCSVTGITASLEQVKYCQSQGLNVWQQDLENENDDIPQGYDIVFSLEMISHIRDKTKFLRRLRSSASRLIISESCAADHYSGERTTFGSSILLCKVSELVNDLESAGWKIQFQQNRRFQLWRTISLWKENLERVYGDKQPPGQLAILRSLVDIAMASPISWCQYFPLIDIVAD